MPALLVESTEIQVLPHFQEQSMLFSLTLTPDISSTALTSQSYSISLLMILTEFESTAQCRGELVPFKV